MLIKFFAIKIFLLTSFAAFAQVAVICGPATDLETIRQDEKKAFVHFNYDHGFSGIEDVRFLKQFGVKQEVLSAKKIRGGKIQVKTSSLSLLFDMTKYCEEGGDVSVLVNDSQQLACDCYED